MVAVCLPKIRKVFIHHIITGGHNVSQLIIGKAHHDQMLYAMLRRDLSQGLRIIVTSGTADQLRKYFSRQQRQRHFTKVHNSQFRLQHIPSIQSPPAIIFKDPQKFVV